MIDPDKLAWDKMDGLIPAIVQSRSNGTVLMLGYINREALNQTLNTRLVTFFSRSKQRLWTKGESSGNRLHLVDAMFDCDCDTLLLIVEATGPICHLGSQSCFGNSASHGNFLEVLEKRISERRSANPAESYTARLLADGIKRIAQKVSEEAVETALAAVTGDRDELLNEVADLMYHLSVLLFSMETRWSDVSLTLSERQAAQTPMA